MIDAGDERFILTFDGGIASEGYIHFYEFGRSTYATARFLNTLEYYRRTGKIPDKITNSRSFEVYSKAPQQGSFFSEVIYSSVQEAAATAINVPLNTLISYVWAMVNPGKEDDEKAIIALAEAMKSSQEQQTKTVESIERIVAGQNAIQQDLIDILKEAKDRKSVV